MDGSKPLIPNEHLKPKPRCCIVVLNFVPTLSIWTHGMSDLHASTRMYWVVVFNPYGAHMDSLWQQKCTSSASIVPRLRRYRFCFGKKHDLANHHMSYVMEKVGLPDVWRYISILFVLHGSFGKTRHKSRNTSRFHLRS